jgi:putative DNA primase/helicase
MTADHYQNHYKILGVRATARSEEIRRAYRRMSRKFHPDVNSDDDAAERLEEINKAFEVLSDAEKRILFDADLAIRKVDSGDPSAGSAGSAGSSGPPQFPPESEYPKPTAPFDVAKRLYKDRALGKEISHLWVYSGEWMAWRGTCWMTIGEDELRQALYPVLAGKWYWHELASHDEPRWWMPTHTKVNNVLHALRAAVLLPNEVNAPSWTEPPAGIDPPPWPPYGANMSDATQTISCANGLLDLSSRTRAPHTPALFNLVSVPFDYDENAPAPIEWLRFLKSVWPNDEDAIRLLAQWFGYVLSGRMEQQKLLLLLGPRRGGKGTIRGVLTQLLGEGNVSHPTMQGLGGDFGLWPLIGKPLAVVSDARIGNTPSHVVTERLLRITGEDPVTINRKNRAQVDVKLPCRIMILSNELPRLTDASGAIASRFMILKMTESWLHKEDLELANKLRSELPGILNWSLGGLADLNNLGKFTIPASSAEEMILLEEMASPTVEFVKEMCSLEPSAECPVDIMYAANRRWRKDNGHSPVAKSVFGRDLRASVSSVKPGASVKSGERTINGVPRTHCYIGIRLNHPADPADTPQT